MVSVPERKREEAPKTMALGRVGEKILRDRSTPEAQRLTVDMPAVCPPGPGMPLTKSSIASSRSA